MKKTRFLVCVIVMLFSLGCISLAYKVGDVINSGVSGYCAKCNQGYGDGTTQSGVYAIPHKTAAVSYHDNYIPDLPHGTVVYVPKAGKSYVINDIAGRKRGGEILIDCYFNTSEHGEGGENQVTTEYNSKTGYVELDKVQILYMPPEGSWGIKNWKNNVYAGLEFLNSGKAIPNSGSASVNSGAALNNGVENITKCTKCSGTIGDIWYLSSGNIHYRACLKDFGHQYFDESATKCTGNGCKYCLINIEKGRCSCGGEIGETWRLLENQHYRVCKNNKDHHIFDANTDKCTGVNCKLCGKMNNTSGTTTANQNKGVLSNIVSPKVTIETIKTCYGNNNTCGGTIGDIWYLSGDNIHYRACLKDFGHQFFDESTKCTGSGCRFCAMNNNKGLCKCGGTIGSEYYITEYGTHYRACSLDFSHQYVEPHKWEGNHCPVCDLYRLTELSETEINNTEPSSYMIYTDLSSEHWAAVEIEKMKNLGIINGYEDGSFRPEGQITAREFFAFLSRVLEKKNVSKSSGKVYLDDKLKDDWSHKEFVSLMQALGTTNTNELGKDEVQMILGENDGIVLENYVKPINRESAASIMAPFVNKSGKVSSVDKNGFADWDQVTLKSRINSLVDAGLLKGRVTSDGSALVICPKDYITRAEAITLIARLYDMI